MTLPPDEAVAYIEAAFGKAMITRAIDSTLGKLKSAGILQDGRVDSITMFEDLSGNEQQIVMATRATYMRFGVYGMLVASVGPPHDDLPEHLAPWVLDKEWRIPREYDIALRAELEDRDGYIDWDEYRQRVREHPAARLVWTDPGDPHDRILVKTSVTPAQPLTCIRLDITVAGDDDDDPHQDRG